MTAVNPMIGVLMVGEKCADLLGAQADKRGGNR
jgi:hypothetical protein